MVSPHPQSSQSFDTREYQTWREVVVNMRSIYFDLVTDTVDVSCFEWSNYLPTAGDDIFECFSLMCKHVVFIATCVVIVLYSFHGVWRVFFLVGNMFCVWLWNIGLFVL